MFLFDFHRRYCTSTMASLDEDNAGLSDDVDRNQGETMY